MRSLPFHCLLARFVIPCLFFPPPPRIRLPPRHKRANVTMEKVAPSLPSFCPPYCKSYFCTAALPADPRSFHLYPRVLGSSIMCSLCSALSRSPAAPDSVAVGRRSRRIWRSCLQRMRAAPVPRIMTYLQVMPYSVDVSSEIRSEHPLFSSSCFTYDPCLPMIQPIFCSGMGMPCVMTISARSIMSGTPCEPGWGGIPFGGCEYPWGL